MTTQLELQNPLLTRRLALGLTQHELAEEVGVSRNFILRAESAEYPEPPKTLCEFYAGGSESELNLLRDLYRAYQRRQREDHFGMLYPYITDPGDFKDDFDASKHPLNCWLELSVRMDPSAPGLEEVYPNVPSLYAVCRAFCVHHAVMHHWLTDRSVRNTPKIFLEALFESGYNEECLIALEGGYRAYRGRV